MRKRRQFTPQYKFETVLEALRGEKTAAQICRERQLSEDLLSRWKQEFLRRAPEVFESRKGSAEGSTQPSLTADYERTRIEELERTVEHLLVEVNVLKRLAQNQTVSVR